MVYNEKLNDIRDIVLLNASRDSIQAALRRRRPGYPAPDARPGPQGFQPRHPDHHGPLRQGGPADEPARRLRRRPVRATPWCSRALRKETSPPPRSCPASELLKESPKLRRPGLSPVHPDAHGRPAARGPRGERDDAQGRRPRPGRTGKGARRSLRRHPPQPELRDRRPGQGDRLQGREVQGQGDRHRHHLPERPARSRPTSPTPRETGPSAPGCPRRSTTPSSARAGPWVGRAFVVNHWYITAYEPIKNIAGEIIGMLYVGMLEKPYIDLRNSVMLTFTGIAALCTSSCSWASSSSSPRASPTRSGGWSGHQPDRPGRPQPSGPDRLPRRDRPARPVVQPDDRERLKAGQREPDPVGKDPGKAGGGADQGAAGDAGLTCSNPRSWRSLGKMAAGRRPRDQQPADVDPDQHPPDAGEARQKARVLSRT